MTNLQINQLIAEYCKWKPTTDGGICWDANGNAIIAPPNYANDLNAMHEAMRTLSEEQVEKVWETLCDMIPFNPHSFRNGLVFDAPAKVRAEAFLRVIGKWEE